MVTGVVRMGQVAAIRVTDEDRREALVEEEQGHATRVHRQHVATRPPLRDEEVFVSQLHHRARLVNGAFQRFVLDVVLRHATQLSPTEQDTPVAAKGHSRPQPPTTLPTGSRGERGVHAVECAFGDGDEGWVEVHLAGVKSAARMREKLGKYAPPHPRARWPLSANILDPVRVSVVCEGPSQVLETVEWFMRLDPDQRRVMAVVRAKNKFSDAREEVW
jgi:hypothetical protein